MATEKLYKHLTFRLVNEDMQKERWEVENFRNGELIGAIKWYAYISWREYRFEMERVCLNAKTLREIAKFMLWLAKTRLKRIAEKNKKDAVNKICNAIAQSDAL